MCNTNEICDTYPESSWYQLLKNARKKRNNHKSHCTLLDNLGQKYSKTDTVLSGAMFYYTPLHYAHIGFCFLCEKSFNF